MTLCVAVVVPQVEPVAFVVCSTAGTEIHWCTSADKLASIFF
ncbi:hypothetical protein [Anthocerotibacter panamensis]|nr:hypothetical protein [Anthocerotibacter panamensis]